MTIDNIKEEIYKAESIIILTHETPDGDAIGSSLAMYNGLKTLNKKVDVVIQDAPQIYNFLQGFDEIKTQVVDNNYDLAIALDCGDVKRLNGYSEYFQNTNTTIEIDHHAVNTMFADHNFVNPMSPACAQILITVLEDLGIEITTEIGECLLTGIITDTGGFKYQGVTTETFEFVAELLNKGVNVSNIYKKVLQTISRNKFELRKIAMNRLEFLEDGKISFTYLNAEDEEKINAEIDAHEGIVELGRDVEGVEISIFLRENKERDGFKISLRSNDYVNVADICLMFSGGGHARAAGGSIKLPLEEAKQKIVEECKKYLK